MASSSERVAAALAAAGHNPEIRVFDASTRTSADAAAAIGCEVAQIAKSLVFRARGSNRPVLVIASGVNRVDEATVATALGERIDGLKIERADAGFVRDATGFAIGGVAPVGHATPPHVVIDRDLLALPLIWAAAGTPNSVFALTPEQLVALTGGVVADIAKRAP
ncbi:prolyl-tRNA editing enzyme YbaK/EbsC (Cys-tRNA(Pro) deacylase) [Inquilinus ginsengisoli]|uniref:YbaK/EbsC family protein n=1 Tax=Inquilinus ginsengisoli TaxID=363840 RepID=UPI003D2157C1